MNSPKMTWRNLEFNADERVKEDKDEEEAEPEEG
jgi:hypothetical protein